MRIALVHHIHSVADPLGMTELNGLTNVKLQAVRRDQSGGKLTRVQADMNLRVNRMQIVEHLHLPVIFAHRHIPVLSHHEVDSDDTRIDRGKLEAEKSLRKHLFRRKSPKDLKQIADFYSAGPILRGIRTAL